MSVISSTIGQPSFYTHFHLATEGTPGYARTSNLIGAANGLNCAGSAFGAVLTAWSADKFGRKAGIQIGSMFSIVGAALCAASVDMGMFLVARFIAGIGVGYSLSGWIGFGCYFLSASGSQSSFPWRFPLAFQAAPALLLLAGTPWLPETPRWLLSHGRAHDAHSVLQRLHHQPGAAHQTVAEKEFYQMTKQLEMDREIWRQLEKEGGGGMFELFRTRSNRKRAWVGFSLMFGNIFTGSIVIANYGVLLYASLGLGAYKPLLLSALWVTVSFPGNVFTAFFVDRIGRRFFLLTGLFGIVITLCFEAALQARYLESTNAAGQRAAVFFLFLFIFFWSTFVDASQYLYLSEIFPTHLRSQGVALGMVGLYTAAVVILVAGPIALDVIKWKFFLVLILPTSLHWVNVYCLFPETKNRSLEDINVAFGEEVAVKYYGAGTEEEEIYAKALAEAEAQGGKASAAVEVGEKDGLADMTRVEDVEKTPR
ncbi:MAG: hypothetical protein Q9227_001118 [Pyrenula ochraceoflavens]